jgi:cytoskeletal protein CcmA (bactofilin family)
MLSSLGKNPNEKPCNTIDTLVGARTELKGDLTFSGGLRIDGKLKGSVTSKGEGDIAGDVYYKILEVAVGAVINGNLVREVSEPAKDKATVARLKPLGGASATEEEG